MWSSSCLCTAGGRPGVCASHSAWQVEEWMKCPHCNCLLSIPPQKVCEHLKLSMYKVEPIIAEPPDRCLCSPICAVISRVRALGPELWLPCLCPCSLWPSLPSSSFPFPPVSTFVSMDMPFSPRSTPRNTSYSPHSDFLPAPNLFCTRPGLLNITVITPKIPV